LSVGIQAAEQTVRLAVRAGGEIKRVGRPSTVVVAAEPDGPQPVDEDRLPLGVAHLAKELAALRIESADMTVAEISDPQGAAQFTETSQKTHGHLEKLLPLAIADSSGVNVNESERERSGIIRGQFYGVWRGGAIFRGAHMFSESRRGPAPRS